MKKGFLLVMLAVFACGTPKQGGLDSGVDVPAGEGVQPDTAVDTSVADSRQVEAVAGDTSTDISGTHWTRPKGYAVLKFCVDDSANKTYRDGQIRWTGSFKWDAKTNTIKYASSWLPTDGPFIPLYDDGPISKGGHEAEGAVAGDHVFCAETYLKADKAYTIEYGTLDEHDHWIWQGPNGTVDIPKGSTKVYDLGTQKLAKFGKIDFKVAIDMSKLNKQFKSVTPDGYDVYVKTSANSWTPVQLLDNGKKGDAKAGDGVFTYQQSQHLGPHDGLVAMGQHVQFVFMFVMQGMDIEDGQEYKVGADCAMDGVAAWTDAAKTGDFEPADVLMERDSRGQVFNTTVIIGGGNPWCKVDKDCFKGKCTSDGCSLGTQEGQLAITGVRPTQGPATGGTKVTISGSGFADGATVQFGGKDADDVTVKDATTITCTTPAHEKGKVDVVVTNPNDKSATLARGFEYIRQNQAVTIEDAVLLDPLTLNVEQGVPSPALNAKVKVKNGDHQSIQAQCGFGPYGSDPGTSGQWQFIKAIYSNDDGGYALYNANLMLATPGKYAFTFRFKGDGDWVYADSTGTADGFDAAKIGTITVPQPVLKPDITSVIPDYGPTNASTSVRIEGHNFKDGAKVLVDGQEITPDSVAEDKITFTAPSHAMGLVDVSVKNPDGQVDTQTGGFVYVPEGTPEIDGTIGADWDPSWQVADNNIETDTAGNELHKMYVAFDNDNLYIGIAGKSDASHYIIGYLDPDYGDGQGYRDMTKLGDNSGNGDLDDALSSTFVIDNTDFGAYWGFGTLGMKSMQATDKPGDFPDAGWRAFIDPQYPDVGPQNFGWEQGAVVCGDSAIELSVPLKSLWGPESARVPMRHHIALVVVITNLYGNKRVNQSLPGKFDSSNPMHLNAVDLWIRPGNEQ